MSADPLITEIAIDQISAEASAQMRIVASESIAAEYAEAISAGSVFPPMVVFFDDTTHWLADGFHRLAAHQSLGYTTIRADLREGGRRDAIQYSLGANEMHGLRRTRADKRRAVETALADHVWATFSDRDIAKMCGVSHTLVAQVRKVGTLAIDKPTAVRTSGYLATIESAHLAIAEPAAGNLATGDDGELVSIVLPMLAKASDDAIVDLICELERVAKKRGIR